MGRKQRDYSEESTKEPVQEQAKEELFEQVATGLSREDIDKIRKEALEKAKTVRHEWRQKGNTLYCKTCPNQHGSYIYGKQLVGINEQGLPILTNRT